MDGVEPRPRPCSTSPVQNSCSPCPCRHVDLHACACTCPHHHQPAVRHPNPGCIPGRCHCTTAMQKHAPLLCKLHQQSGSVRRPSNSVMRRPLKPLGMNWARPVVSNTAASNHCENHACGGCSQSLTMCSRHDTAHASRHTQTRPTHTHTHECAEARVLQ